MEHEHAQPRDIPPGRRLRTDRDEHAAGREIRGALGVERAVCETGGVEDDVEAPRRRVRGERCGDIGRCVVYELIPRRR